jgi:excisionase family DNA binding protein
MNATQVQPPLALRPKEAAKALGISSRTLWQLTHDGAIGCVKTGSGKRRIVLYPVKVLEDWLKRNTQVSDQERRTDYGAEEDAT